LGKQKTSKIWRDLGQLLSLTANISRTGHDIDKGTQPSSRAIPAALKKHLVNFGLQTKSYRRRCWPTQI